MSALISLLLVLAPACGALCRPEDKQPWLELSKPHFARVEKSRQAALMVLQAEPSDATALMSLLENQLLLRQRAEARLSAQKLTRLLSPRDPRYFRVASLLAAHQDYVAAIPLMENVQREFPQSYEVNFNLALAFFYSQAYEKAAETLGPLVRHDPQAEAYNLLAMVEEQRQRYLEAVSAFQKAAELEPRNEDYRFDYGYELLRHQTTDAAIAVFAGGVRDFPSSGKLRIGLGCAYYVAGKYEGPHRAFFRPQHLIPTIGWHTSFWARFTKRHLHFRTPSLTSSGLTRNRDRTTLGFTITMGSSYICAPRTIPTPITSRPNPI